MAELDGLLSRESAGDPSSTRKWPPKRPSKIAENLKKLGIDISCRTVARLLKSMGYSLNTDFHKLNNHQNSALIMRSK